MTGLACGRLGGKRVLCALAVVLVVAVATSCHAMGPLHEAAATGNAEFVRSWISQKRNLDVTYDEPSTGLEGNLTRSRGLTALMTAARMGQLEAVKLLVEGGANLYLESRWRDGTNPRTAFDFAVEARRLAVVEYLWARSDGVRLASRLAEHIASTCAERCDEKFGGDARSNLALFLISIARDDVMLGRGLSEAACYARHPLRMLAFLDTHGVRFPRNTLQCIAYRPAFRDLHAIQERIAIAAFLLDHGADPNDLPYAPLRGAAAAHDLEMVKFLLSRGADPNLQNADGLTAIGAAANTCTYGGTAAQLEPRQKPQLAVIEYLAQAGADVTLYATDGGRSRLKILTKCCTAKDQTATQRRICEVFGL